MHVSSYDKNGRHTTARNDERVKKFLLEIKDTGYEGLITIELDDLSYGEMTYEDKVEELKKEREFLEKFI
uniref:Sugar phosphate isomerase/epimerase n=1 Tax=Geoglobus ahangari TaxID=113653 RepID=A0A7J3THB9_9EURY